MYYLMYYLKTNNKFMKNFFLTVSQDQNKEVSLAGILIQSFYIVYIPLVFIAVNNW